MTFFDAMHFYGFMIFVLSLLRFVFIILTGLFIILELWTWIEMTLKSYDLTRVYCKLFHKKHYKPRIISYAGSNFNTRQCKRCGHYH